MYQSAMCVVRGLAMGVLACLAFTVLTSRMMKKNRQFRHKANRAKHAVGDLMHNVEYLFR